MVFTFEELEVLEKLGYAKSENISKDEYLELRENGKNVAIVEDDYVNPYKKFTIDKNIDLDFIKRLMNSQNYQFLKQTESHANIIKK